MTRLTPDADRAISMRYAPLVYEMYMDMTIVRLTSGQQTTTPSFGAQERSTLINPLERLLGNKRLGDRCHVHFLREMSPDRGRNRKEGRNVWVNLHGRTFLTAGIIHNWVRHMPRK